MGQQKAGQVVDREAKLVAVGGGLPRSARCAEARVVDQNVEAIRPLPHGLTEVPHLGQ